MENYSLKKNFRLMGEAFYSPKSLINNLINETKLFQYSLLPLILFTAGYEFLSILAFIFKQPLIPLPKILPISDEQYQFFQIFFLPVVHIVDFIVFYAVLYGFSRIIRDHTIDISIITYFFIFIWNTIGLISFTLDLISYVWPWEFWFYIHPITGIIYAIYGVEFIHKQSEIKRSKAALLFIPSMVTFFFFRMLFIR